MKNKIALKSLLIPLSILLSSVISLAQTQSQVPADRAVAQPGRWANEYASTVQSNQRYGMQIQPSDLARSIIYQLQAQQQQNRNGQTIESRLFRSGTGGWDPETAKLSDSRDQDLQLMVRAYTTGGCDSQSLNLGLAALARQAIETLTLELGVLSETQANCLLEALY